MSLRNWVLQHSATTQFRNRLRRLYWAYRARRLTRTPVPHRVRSVLFVCKGNICRSPFAAVRARQVFTDCGLTLVRCASAGLTPSKSPGCPPEAITAARRYEVALDDHQVVPLTTPLIEAHDLVVVMEAGQLATVRRRWPTHRSRVVLLPLFATTAAEADDSYQRLNIPDPYGRSGTEFDRCYDRIDVALRGLASELLARRAHLS